MVWTCTTEGDGEFIDRMWRPRERPRRRPRD